MKTKTLMIGLILAAIVLAPLAIAADEAPQRGPRVPREGRGGFGPGSQWQRPGGQQGDLARSLLGRMGERLDLTQEQKDAIKAIADSNKEKTEATRNAVRDAMGALHEAAAKGTEAEIIAAGKAVGDAFTEQALQRAKTMKQVKEVLNEEQLVKLDEMQAQRIERMQQRREAGDRPQKGPGGRDGRKGYGKRQRPPQDPPLEEE